MSAEQSTIPVAYRDIPGFLGYRAGSDGSIWSRRQSAKWRRLKPLPHKTSTRITCLVVVLCRQSGEKRRNYRVHRLVLLAFYGPCPKGMEACHWDGDPSNNRLDNLRWDTSKGNAKDSLRLGRMRIGSAQPLAKLHESDIPEIRRLTASGMPQQDIARLYGVTAPCISAITRGLKWRHVS